MNQERETAYAGYDGLVNLAARPARNSVRFYERQKLDVTCAAPAAVTPVRTEERVGTIDPLKNAPSLGAALALQGVDRAMPVLHAAQGCTFLGKVLAIRHFNEPIALGTTKLFTEDVVMGSDEAAAKTLRVARLPRRRPRRHRARLRRPCRGQGRRRRRARRARSTASCAPHVLAVHAPDYAGGLEEGYLAAVRSLLTLAEPPAPGAAPRPPRVTVLAGSHLSPADARELRDIVEAFGLMPTIVPDLSALDGSRDAFSRAGESAA